MITGENPRRKPNYFEDCTGSVLRSKAAQYVKSNREFRQGGGDADLCVTIGFRQFQGFPCKDVLTLFATSAAREHNVRVFPDLGSDRWEIAVVSKPATRRGTTMSTPVFSNFLAKAIT